MDSYVGCAFKFIVESKQDNRERQQHGVGLDLSLHAGKSKTTTINHKLVLLVVMDNDSIHWKLNPSAVI